MKIWAEIFEFLGACDELSFVGRLPWQPYIHDITDRRAYKPCRSRRWAVPD